MGRLLINDETGEEVWQDDSGQILHIEEPGLLVQAGRQFADLGSGAKHLYGNLTDQPELVNAANLETLQRNRAFEAADEAYPYQSMIGQAVPGLATAPLGGFLTNIALGAGESALDLGQGGDMTQRAMAGAGGALAGDLAGRALGRVWNSARGLVDDIRLGRGRAANPRAAEFEDKGFSTMGSQRAVPGSQEQRVLERLEQGAEASMFSPGMQASVREANQAGFRDVVQRAIGLDVGDFDDLGPEALQAANNRLSEGFADVAAKASAQAPMGIPADLARSIETTRGQIPELIKRGRFAGLNNNKLSGNDWNIARRALSQDAANRAGKGEYELADELFADVETLDRMMESRLGDDTLDEFARLREQYRAFKTVNKDGVINQDGEVVVRSLNRRLRQNTGFGDTAKLGRDTTNPETRELIDVARLGASPEFQPFRSSGTAENLSAQRMAGMALDPTQWLSLAGEAVAPAVTGLTSSRGGRAVTGAMTPAPIQGPVIGGGVGRSMLDELFYPFVGADDDRPQQ